MDKITEKKKVKRIPKCSCCRVSKTEDPSVSYRLDPYDLDINDKRVWKWLCDNCDNEIAQDI